MGNDIFSSLASFFEQDDTSDVTNVTDATNVTEQSSLNESLLSDLSESTSSTSEETSKSVKSKKRRADSNKKDGIEVSSQINSKSPFAYISGLMGDTKDLGSTEDSVPDAEDDFADSISEESLSPLSAVPTGSSGAKSDSVETGVPALDFTGLGVGLMNDDMFQSLLNSEVANTVPETVADVSEKSAEPTVTASPNLLSQLNTGTSPASVFDVLKSVQQNTFMQEEPVPAVADSKEDKIPPVNPLNPSHINYTVPDDVSDTAPKQVGRPGLENALSNSSNNYTDEFIQSLRGVDKDGSSKKYAKVKTQMAQEYANGVGMNLSDLVEQSLTTPFFYNDVEALGSFKCGAEKMYSSNKSNASRGVSDSGSQKQSKDSVKILGLIVRCLKPMKVPCISSKYTLQTGWKSTDVTWVDVKAGDVVYLTKAELFVFLCSTPEGVLNLGSGFTMKTESGLVEDGCNVLFSLRFDTYQKKTNPNALPTLLFNFVLPSGVKADINAEDILIDSTASPTVDNLKPEYKEKMTPYILSLSSSKNKVDVSQKAKEMQNERVAAANTCCNLAAMAQALNRMYSNVATLKQK